eukprot:109694-Hanusia_phi.AAC.1
MISLAGCHSGLHARSGDPALGVRASVAARRWPPPGPVAWAHCGPGPGLRLCRLRSHGTVTTVAGSLSLCRTLLSDWQWAGAA